MLDIEILEIAGLRSVLEALRLPYGKECRSKTDAQFNTDKSGLIVSTSSCCTVSPKDLHLLSVLVKRGDAHAKVLRGMMVWIEINAPVYWWCEMETHRMGHERLSSESTMHIDAKGLTGEELVECKRNIPMGKMLKKVDMFSYQCLRNIYKLRHDHRLPEWHEFCRWIEEELPFAKELILTDYEVQG